MTALESVQTGWLWEHGTFGIASTKVKPLSEIGDRKFRDYDGHRVEVVSWDSEGRQRRRRLPPLACQSSLSRTATPKPRKRRGLGGLTSYARKVLVGSVRRMEIESGQARLSFATLTLPPASQESYRAIAADSSRVLHVFSQRLQRRLRRAGLPGEIVSVWEFQPKRSNKTAYPVLHLHMVFVGRAGRGTWAITPSVIRDMWRDVCISAHEDFSLCSFDSSENVQRVKTSVAAYLGKYLSKGVEGLGEALEVGEDAIPRTWYSVTTTLKKRVLAARVRLSGRMATGFLDWVESGTSDVIFIRSVKIILSDGVEIPIGKHGRIKESAVPQWRDIMREIREAVREGSSWKLSR